ncbi:hypothetical protein LIR51_17955 [Blautia producta]|uniref:hypothetical protein n=1 Tax=Blautia producta TaxID=33035 RepID=UPI001D03E1C2|nr:hypothetical protein [Blautia producta]MCB5876702.1 hypothetical protein [Blautia producta]
MRAVKGNKEYMIDESQQKGYQDMGFDILNDDGGVIAYGRGKTVPYDDHMKAVKEIERLQGLCAELQEEKAGLQKELETYKVEKKPASRKGDA